MKTERKSILKRDVDTFFTRPIYYLLTLYFGGWTFFAISAVRYSNALERGSIPQSTKVSFITLGILSIFSVVHLCGIVSGTKSTTFPGMLFSVMVSGWEKKKGIDILESNEMNF